MTYELVNRRTGNTLGDFPSEQAALSLYERVLEQDQQLAEELVIVEFDDGGAAVATRTPAEHYV